MCRRCLVPLTGVDTVEIDEGQAVTLVGSDLGSGSATLLREGTEEELDEMWAVNVKAPARLTSRQAPC